MPPSFLEAHPAVSPRGRVKSIRGTSGPTLTGPRALSGPLPHRVLQPCPGARISGESRPVRSHRRATLTRWAGRTRTGGGGGMRGPTKKAAWVAALAVTATVLGFVLVT